VLETESAPAPDPGVLPGATLTFNTDFEGLLRLCQQHYNQQDGMTPAWLPERMFRIFTELFERGLVHAQEVWQDRDLVGGFFGICLGSLCFGEYAVETTPGAASLAILQAAAELKKKGVGLVDMQKETARTDQLEYQEVSRVAFIDLCRVAASQHETASKSDLS
jgi:leucyl/phenylalanyl-tRNA--protein transferase